MFDQKLTALWFLCLNAGAVTASSSASTFDSSSTYSSVASLDKYGNSVQLRHAMEASRRYGTLLVAALCCDEDFDNDYGKNDKLEARARPHNAIVVCSTTSTPRPGTKLLNSPRSPQGAVHLLAQDDHLDDILLSTAPPPTCLQKSLTAAAFTGWHADAVLLLRLLRSYASRTWMRYDVILDGGRAAQALSVILLAFMGYDTAAEICNGVDVYGGEDEELDMGRPFGVTSLIFDIIVKKGRRNGGVVASMRSVDPSGIQQAWMARAVGRGSDEANVLLEQRWRPYLSLKEAQELCMEIVNEVQHGKDKEKQVVDMKEVEEEDHERVICETLTAGKGVRVDLVNSEKKRIMDKTPPAQDS